MPKISPSSRTNVPPAQNLSPALSTQDEVSSGASPRPGESPAWKPERPEGASAPDASQAQFHSPVLDAETTPSGRLEVPSEAKAKLTTEVRTGTAHVPTGTIQLAGVPQAPAAFTPGPWFAVGYNRMIRSSESGYEGQTICLLEANRGETLFANHEANAHLIAASPEMYAELCDARDWVRHWRRDVEAGLKPTIESLRIAEEGINLALAKANGGNQ